MSPLTFHKLNRNKHAGEGGEGGGGGLKGKGYKGWLVLHHILSREEDLSQV